ncbi:hypothetical protein HDU84_008658 [Entophlyctis sp. JEL0112]|nr:hypothetical protein HDU84_008658 [Entophlyctis sp. JEL0112]
MTTGVHWKYLRRIGMQWRVFCAWTNVRIVLNIGDGLMSVDKENMTASAWSGFHKKALRERQNQLRLVYPALFSQHPLPPTQQHPVSVPSYSHSLQDPRASPSAASSASSSLAYDSTSSLVGLDAASAPDVAPFPITGLDEKIADNMIEYV